MDPSGEKEEEDRVSEVKVVIVVVIWTWMEGNWWSIDVSIPGVYIHGRNPRVRQWFSVKPVLFLQGLELNSNINNYGKYCSNFGVPGCCMWMALTGST